MCKSISTNFTKLFIIVGIIIFMVLIGMNFIIFHSSVCYYPILKSAPVDTTWLSKQARLPKQVVVIYADSVPSDKIALQLDSALRLMHEEQQRILDYQNTLTDDIRQETNNYINKANGWISIWLGLITVLGVFIPLVLQYQAKVESKREKEDQEKNFNIIKDQLERYKNSLKNEVQYTLNENKSQFTQLENHINSEMERLSKLVKNSEVINLTRALEVCNDYQLIENHTGSLHTHAQKLFWHKSINILNEIVKQSFDENNILKLEHKDNLLQSLIIFFGITRNYIIPADHHRHKDYDRAVDLLRKAITSLSENEGISSSSYHKSISELTDHLSSLF